MACLPVRCWQNSYEPDYPVGQLLILSGIANEDFTLLLEQLRTKKVVTFRALMRCGKRMNAIRWINRLPTLPERLIAFTMDTVPNGATEATRPLQQED